MRSIKRYLVFNIGCLECGVSSDVVGTYATEEEAKQVAALMSKKLDWREGGQNEFLVFDLLAAQADEYKAVLNTMDGTILEERKLLK
jgi:hypothetical protein